MSLPPTPPTSPTPTLAVVLIDKPRKDGRYSVRLRLTIARKSAYETLCYCHARHWQAGTATVRPAEAGARAMNDFIQQRIADVRALLRVYEAEHWTLTPQQVLSIDYPAWKAHRDTGEVRPTQPHSFLAHAQLLIDLKTKAGAYTSAKRYTTYLKTLQAYLSTLGRPELLLGEIDDDFLTGFFAYLRSARADGRANSDNTLHRRFGWFKTVLHDAHKEGLISRMPYRRFKTRPVKTGKTKLTLDEIQRIEQLARDPATKPYLALRLDIFLLQFYLYGSRISDVLTLKNHHLIGPAGCPERVEFTQRKTDRFMSIRVGAGALAILGRHARPHQPDAFVFNWLKWEYTVTQSPAWNVARLEEEIESKTVKVNEALKEAAKTLGIEKNISTHVARHSFAQQMKRKKKPIDAIKQALGHTKISQTEVYLADLDWEELDEALADAYD